MQISMWHGLSSRPDWGGVQIRTPQRESKLYSLNLFVSRPEEVEGRRPIYSVLAEAEASSSACSALTSAFISALTGDVGSV